MRSSNYRVFAIHVPTISHAGAPSRFTDWSPILHPCPIHSLTMTSAPHLNLAPGHPVNGNRAYIAGSKTSRKPLWLIVSSSLRSYSHRVFRSRTIYQKTSRVKHPHNQKVPGASYALQPDFTMGLPYSRQINAAFEEVTPLVAAGFKVLRTTRNISILLAVIQVLTVWFLFLILIGIVALLYCVNPDLEVSKTKEKRGEEGMKGQWERGGMIVV
jgi:hypothetical protein